MKRLNKQLRQFLLTVCILPVLLLSGSRSIAQIKFSAIPSFNTISRDQALQVEFVVEGSDQLDNFTAPSFENFNIIQGPHYGTYLSVNNGAVSKGTTVTYLLMPRKPGKLIIPPAQIKVNGKILKSNAISITVLDQLSGNNNNANNLPVPVMPGLNTNSNRNNNDFKDYILKKGEDPIAKIQKNLIAKVDVSKTSCYVGEPIVVTYKLYTKLKSVSKVTKRPSFNGFSVVELTTPESMDFQPDQLNGKEYYSTVLRKVQLFPLQSGELTIDPIEIASEVSFLRAGETKNKTAGGIDDLFNDFFNEDMLNGETEVHRLTQQTKPVAITVKQLPEQNKPADFNGAVGKFSLQAALVNNKIAANETGTYKIIIEGKGNLPMINAPGINWPKGLEGFEPTARENYSDNTIPLSGTKTYEYAFTVNEKGDYILPAVTFSYFNPETGNYEKAISNTVSFTVNQVAQKKAAPVVNEYEEATRESWKEKATRYFEDIKNTEWWWPLMGVVLLGWGIYQWQQNRKYTRVKNELKEIIKKEAAAPEVIPLTDGVITTFNTDPLDKARQELKKENTTGFYSELRTALWTYLQQKYQLSPTDLNKKTVAEKLRTDLFSEELIDGFMQLQDVCEMALFTPVHTQAERYQLLQQAETFIKTVENRIL